MSPTLLAFSGLLLLLFTLLGLWVGRTMGRAEAATALAEERRMAEEAQRGIQTPLALAHREAQTKVEERDEQLKALHQERVDLRDEIGKAQELLRIQAGKIGEAGQVNKTFEALQETHKAREEDFAGLQKELQKELSEAQGRVVKLETSAAKDQQALAKERQQLEASRQAFRQEFVNLANQIFEDKHLAFDAQSKEGLTHLLAPFKEQLDTFRRRVDQVHMENVQGHTSLKGELDRLRELNQQITKEASNLTRALKGDKKIQGNWGEQKVELLLEQAGLRKGIEYGREQNFKDDGGNNLRPDFVVNLPEGKHIIIDSKVSLVDYAAYVAAESPEEGQPFLAAHVAALRNHIRSLSGKKYPELLHMDSPDFTFLFIAIEPAYLAAAAHSPLLFQEAYDRRIVLVTATTLFPVLRVVSNLWSLQRQNQSTQLLAEQASRVYDKLRVFIVKMEKLGGQIETSQQTYKDAFDTLKDGKGSLVKTVDKFVDLGVQVSKKLPTSVTGGALPELASAEAAGEVDAPAEP
ncbi:MAG: DNA recombination protein RmuC [Geothrix sp.]|nr:DNA recombination protein RmuC [Geothrix sp.]